MPSDRTSKILAILLPSALVVIGVVTAILFYGVPDHLAGLLPNDQAKSIIADCGGGLVCQGLMAFLPTFFHALGRAAPFVPYILLSLLAVAAWLGARAIAGNDHEHPRVRAWVLPLLLLGAIWLLFTTLAGADIGRGAPLARLADPAAYQNVDADTLAALRTSFADLQTRGCLTPVAGTPFYDLTMACSQQSFFTLVLPAFLFVSLVFLDFLLLGAALLSWLRLKPRHGLTPGLEFLVSLGLGIGGIVAVLWLLAVAGLVTPWSGWVLLLGIPVICWKQALALWQRARETSFELPSRFGGWPLVIGWALIGLLALNFLSVIRPFPIGWDDLGSYLNRPHLLVEYGGFIPKMASFQWEYVTSLGFWIFGSETEFGAVASMLLNWLAGVVAVLAAIGVARLVLKRGGLLTGFFYALLPVVGHFSFADMKIDNAVFAMSALATACVFAALFSGDADRPVEPRDRRLWLLLAGVFAGLAFGFKVTAAMTIFALLAVLAGAELGALGAVGVSFVALAAFVAQGTFNASAFASRFFATPLTVPALPLMIVAALAAAACLWWAARRRAWRPAGLDAAFFLIGAIVVVLPWIIHNNVYNRYWPPSLAFTAENRLSAAISLEPDFASDIRDVRVLPPELQPDLTSAACLSTGTAEELDRYWGAGTGPAHYLLLPWRTILNLDNGGYYVTTSFFLFLLPLLLLAPAFWQPGSRRLRWLVVFTLIQAVEWALLANGILWYGIGMFIGIAAMAEALLVESPNRRTRWIVGVFLGLSLLTSASLRIWQFEMQGGSLEYVIGKVNADVVYAQTIPHYREVAALVDSRAESIPDRPFTLRMGTFIPYFVPRNAERLPLSDNQLDFFSCVAQENDPALTTARLKAFGFNSVIFDLNTATIEADLEGTLHQKVQRFVTYASDPASGLQPVVVDQQSGIAYFLIP
ncbi:MAG: glycosyltransferase family 39 protein [Candidatus Peribacteraceae bacterium]|nr:glycosyltransferase family 39 protein [Candidatus Peribacteraceae bacterium]